MTCLKLSGEVFKERKNEFILFMRPSLAIQDYNNLETRFTGVLSKPVRDRLRKPAAKQG
jgi:hypothetical protein